MAEAVEMSSHHRQITTFVYLFFPKFPCGITLEQFPKHQHLRLVGLAAVVVCQVGGQRDEPLAFLSVISDVNGHRLQRHQENPHWLCSSLLAFSQILAKIPAYNVRFFGQLPEVELSFSGQSVVLILYGTSINIECVT